MMMKVFPSLRGKILTKIQLWEPPTLPRRGKNNKNLGKKNQIFWSGRRKNGNFLRGDGNGLGMGEKWEFCPKKSYFHSYLNTSQGGKGKVLLE